MKTKNKSLDVSVPSDKDLIALTVARAKDVADKTGSTPGVLMRDIVNDNQILSDLEKGTRSISLRLYQKIHDGLSERLRGAR